MDQGKQITVQAAPNLAVVKYWGKLNHEINLPLNASLGIPLGDLNCRVTLRAHHRDDWEGDLSFFAKDTKQRILEFIAYFRYQYPEFPYVSGKSLSNFPAGCGISSSSAFFAALTGAMMTWMGVKDQAQIARMARVGSGSATRSVFGNCWVGWLPGSDETSHGYPIANTQLPSGWIDRMLVYEGKHKALPSRQGHLMMDHSPLKDARVSHANMRFMQICRDIKHQNWNAICDWIVDDTVDFVHVVDCHIEDPYLCPEARIALDQLVDLHRREASLRPWFVTVDAGSTVHVVGDQRVLDLVMSRIQKVPAVTLVSGIRGGGLQHIQPTQPLTKITSVLKQAPIVDHFEKR